MRTSWRGWREAGLGMAVGGAAGLLLIELNLPSLVSYWGDPSPLVVGAAIVGAALWGTRFRGLVLAATLTLALLWSAVAFTPLCRWLGRGFPRRDPPAAADAVFVFSSRLQSHGELTSASMSRLLHGLELLGEGWAPRLILSELRPPQPSYAAAADALMVHLRLGRELLTVGPVSNTHDEAVALAALLREKGWKRVLVVTSPLHSRRACAALEGQGVEVISSPATETRFDLEGLYRGDERLVAFGALLHERLGLWIYARRGWLAPPGPVTGS
jgi:uncharacterized SAM-binding protein YcdF (DUF218 family)